MGNRVIHQIKEVLLGTPRLKDRVVSIFDPEAGPIVKGRLKKPVEFGRKLFLSEIEGRIITSYELLKGNLSDTEYLLSTVNAHAIGYCRKWELGWLWNYDL